MPKYARALASRGREEVLTPDGWTGAYWRNKSMTLNKLLIYLSGRRSGGEKKEEAAAVRRRPRGKMRFGNVAGGVDKDVVTLLKLGFTPE